MISTKDKVLWERLINIRSVQFQSRSDAQTGWNGSACGTVTVMIDHNNSFRFIEKGIWTSNQGISTSFSNVYRWSIDHKLIHLEHLRYGEHNPVYLFDLNRIDKFEWQSVSPHVCKKDIYSCLLVLKPEMIQMNWKIKGPKKNEMIFYDYF